MYLQTQRFGIQYKWKKLEKGKIMYQYISRKEEDTICFASKLASVLQKGDLIWLSGDLGAGKTKFTQGILRYFEMENQISSPTFTIVNEYKNERAEIYHFDVYRLENEDEFWAIGGEEYFEKGICLIEWGERIAEILPKPYLKISLEKVEEDLEERKITIKGFGEIRKEILDFLEAESENISD